MKRTGVALAAIAGLVMLLTSCGSPTITGIKVHIQNHEYQDAVDLADEAIASGENVTAGLMALTLQEMDVPARSWQGWQVPLKTTSAHASARIEEIGTDAISAKFAEGMRVAVVAGFQGISPENRVTTLGRGGSDTTAVAFAAAARRMAAVPISAFMTAVPSFARPSKISALACAIWSMLSKASICTAATVVITATSGQA